MSKAKTTHKVVREIKQRIYGDFGLLIQDFRVILHATSHALAPLVIEKDRGQLFKIESALHS